MTVNPCHKAGFDEVNDDVQDLLESHAELLSNNELIELDKASQEADKKGDKEEELVHVDIKTLRECLSDIEKALETLKERDPNPARSSKMAHDVEKIRPVTPANLATAGSSISTADSSTASPSSISSFFKPVKCADSATAGPFTSASNSADDDVLSSSAHSAEDD
ncbi:hypothetical protein E2C01_093991 [Portunus trituberculatus]|uniref:Uncharacterized protein n=1 Tax=Portunus trituberculatus TaxID=210409 RepID=A0A5B7JZN0_PORTR|nr:hypothetical protein [Portunus trituberculatus]